MSAKLPMVAPVYLPGQEPLPAGVTEEDRAQMAQMEYWGKFAGLAMESCPTKCALSGAAGLALGGFFSLMGATLAMDDPLRRTHMGLAPVGPGGVEPPKMSAAQQTKIFFKEMGAGMWRSGKGFGKVGALYAGIECCIEGYRAKNDIQNPLYAGALAGGILARNAGPQAMIGGAAAFAAFSGLIDLYFRRETADDD